MDICIDVGNTTVSFGFYKKETLFKRFCFGTKDYHTPDEMVAAMNPIIREYGIDAKEAEKIIYSSVVPSLDAPLLDAVNKIFNIKPIIVRPGIKTGLIIKVDNPNEIGGDLIADLVGAKEKYHYPVIIIDLGTASKILYLDEKGVFSTCLILPGLDISKSVLSTKAALLPEIGFKKPKPVLDCHNTIDAMNAGVIYAHTYGVEGIVNQFFKEIGKEVPVIITGGVAESLKEYLQEYNYDPNLTLDGLEIILNKSK